MKDLYLSFALLVVGFATLQMRATRAPYDYRKELLVGDATQEKSLVNAMDKALKAVESSKARPRISK